MGLRIPEGAVVVAGARRAAGAFAEANGLSLYTPVIVKYRDEDGRRDGPGGSAQVFSFGLSVSRRETQVCDVDGAGRESR